MSMLKDNFINIIVLIGSVIVGFAFVEVGYRAFLYYSYAVNLDFPIVTTDARALNAHNLAVEGNIRGLFAPGPMTYTFFAPSGEMWQRIKIPVNNLGWTSRFDYSCEKQPSEYRIAVVGDSMTASITNTDSWVDFLQEHLTSDSELLAALNVEKITVLNLGMAGASMKAMAGTQTPIARSFSADMVVVNFPIEDIARRIGVIPTGPKPLSSCTDVAPDPAEPIDSLKIDGVEIPTPCDLASPGCSVYPIWYVPPHLSLDEEDLKGIKRKVAQLILWERVIKSTQSVVFLELIGRPAIKGARKPSSLLKSKSEIEKEDIQIGLNALQYIKSVHDNVLITHNVLQWHIDDKVRPPVLDKFIAAAVEIDIDIVQMRDHMPIKDGEDEWYRWYNLPHDGHWSDYGAKVYSKAMYNVIRKNLLNSVNKEKPSLN